MSFLSPCVLPLVPLYMSYLSAGASDTDEDGNTKYKASRTFVMTLFFVAGISVTFLIIAFSVSYISSLIEMYRDIIAIIGGTLIIIFGLHETGIIHVSFVDRELRLPFSMDLNSMNALKAFIMGFLFSFAWTPCIGPMLASAIIAASTQEFGYLYILVYACGLLIPFLITGLLTSKVLELINRFKRALRYVMIVAGIILVFFGSKMIYDSSKNIISYQNAQSAADETSGSRTVFELADGTRIDLNDSKGKYVFLNFITSWCGYCRQEIPEYKAFSTFEGADCYYVMSEDYNGNSMSIDEFIAENDISIPVINDSDNYLFSSYGVNAFPIVFVLGPDGSMIGYSSGYTSADGFMNIYQNAVEIYTQNQK